MQQMFQQCYGNVELQSLASQAAHQRLLLLASSNCKKMQIMQMWCDMQSKLTQVYPEWVLVLMNKRRTRSRRLLSCSCMCKKGVLCAS